MGIHEDHWRSGSQADGQLLLRAGRYDQHGQHFVLQRIDLHVLHAVLLEGIDLDLGRKAYILRPGRETFSQTFDDVRAWRRR